MSIPAQGAEGAETMTAGQSLDLRDLHAANIARQAEWCPDQVPDLSFRGNELGGECGEAQNVIKKLERERQGWRGSRATKDDLADELADVVICADLCAVTADIDLGAAVRRKFNATSEKQGLSVFLPLPALASPRADSDERTVDDAPWPEQYARLADGYGPVEEWRDWTKQAGRDPLSPGALHALRGMVGEFATPAQPAGAVPDSLRALARDLMDFHDALAGGVGNGAITIRCESETEQTRRNFRAVLREAAKALLASHPSGQSAGSGAETVWTHPHLPSVAKAAVAEAQAINAALAPDSTRTGQAEAIARAAYVRICRHDSKEGWQHAGADFDRREEDGGCYVNALELALAIGSDAAAALAARPAAPEAQGNSQATSDVLAERHRQGKVEGWTTESDDLYAYGEMARAAACYAQQSAEPKKVEEGSAPYGWPWHSSWWKPTTPRRNLVKAGALILAEIERLDRAAPPASSGQGGR